MECKSITAYIPDNPDIYEFLTGIQYLNFVADIFGIEQSVRQEKLKLMEIFLELQRILAI